MTAIETPASPDLIADNAPEWVEYRDRERRNGTLPRGTYDAHIRAVHIVKRRDTDTHVLRLIVRTINLGRDGLCWQGLSDNPDDPFDLTESQVKQLRKFADRLGIPTPCPAEDVVRALAEYVRDAVVVQAKVTQTPVGQQLQLARPLTGEVLPAIVDAEPTEGLARIAHDAHKRVVEGLNASRLGLAVAASGCHELHKTEGWRALGFTTLTEYLASPEVTVDRAQFYRLVDIYDQYVLEGGIDPVALQGAAESKLEVPLPALKQGMVTVAEAVADATSMPRRDLRVKYAELLGGEPQDGKPNGTSRRRDSDGATVPVSVARQLTAILQRVLSEIGAPEQKRMGRDLRDAVLEVLALAREHALDAEAE